MREGDAFPPSHPNLELELDLTEHLQPGTVKLSQALQLRPSWSKLRKSQTEEEQREPPRFTS